MVLRSPAGGISGCRPQPAKSKVLDNKRVNRAIGLCLFIGDSYNILGWAGVKRCLLAGVGAGEDGFVEDVALHVGKEVGFGGG